METKFIADDNVGKLARWLRMVGYDTLFISGLDDNQLIRIALKEDRTLLTRDTQIMKRRIVTIGRLKALFVEDDDPREQLRQVVRVMGLNCREKQFTRCLECNSLLLPQSKEEIRELVPPYVFKTQDQFMQCPDCHRIYWRGTHWHRMKGEIEKLVSIS
jgi:hypothetical protein